MAQVQNNEEKIFADGFSFKRQDNAPDFVVGRVSVKCDEAVSFMKKHQKLVSPKNLFRLCALYN